MSVCIYRKVIVMVVSLVLTGCGVTFQSTQFNFLKSLFDVDSSVSEPNWIVTWRDRVYPVYAINHDGGTLFVNEDRLLVTFDGWQVTDLSLPGSRTKKVAVLNKVVSDDGTVSMQFEDGRGRRLETHLCEAWERFSESKEKVLRTGNLTIWTQQCSRPDETYTNEIRLNELGQLIALRFFLVPGIAPIKIELL